MPLARAANPHEVDAVLSRVESFSEKELDGLPFGMIQLDRSGKILRFNRTEAELARLRQERQLGKSFFDQVAPCTKVKAFYGRFLEGLEKKQLYETFGFVFKFAHGWRNVAVTLMYSQATRLGLGARLPAVGVDPASRLHPGRPTGARALGPAHGRWPSSHDARATANGAPKSRSRTQTPS